MLSHTIFSGIDSVRLPRRVCSPFPSAGETYATGCNDTRARACSKMTLPQTHLSVATQYTMLESNTILYFKQPVVVRFVLYRHAEGAQQSIHIASPNGPTKSELRTLTVTLYDIR